MKGRTVLAMSLAVLMVLPLGAAMLPAPAGLPEEPSGNFLSEFEVVPGYTPGGMSFDELRGLFGDSLGADRAGLEQLGHYGMGILGPDHASWLREFAGKAAATSTEIIDGPAVFTHGSTVVLSANTVIAGSVTYDHVTLIFEVPPGGGHRTITVAASGSLTITNSLVKNSNGDRLDYGLITADGNLLLDNNRFEQMVVYGRHTGVPESGTQTITNNYFTNGPYGVFTDRDAITIEHNTFFKNNYGVFTDDRGALNANDGSDWGLVQNPEVRSNVFEMNEIGIRVDTDQNPDNTEALGTYEGNEIRANIIGVQCYSAGWYNPDAPEEYLYPTFNDNNIYDNWGDALNNLRGITITIPGVGDVSVADSACKFDGNYLGSDSIFISSNDEITNPANEPVANTAPALPFDLVVIDEDTTWDAANPPPEITGPVIVASEATLTIEDITLESDFTIGSQLGGQLLMDNVEVNNANGIVLRNDNDRIENSDFTGTQLFDPITLFRNNSTNILDNTIVGEARDRNIGISFIAGQFTEEYQFAAGFSGNDISNVAFGHISATMTVTISDNDFHDIGLPEDGFTLSCLVSFGVAGIISTMNMDGNTFDNVPNAITGQLMTLASTDDRFDRGAAGISSCLLNTFTFTTAVFSNYAFAGNMALDKFTMTLSNVTHNAFGFYMGAGTGFSFTNVDFYNNIGPGVAPHSITINAAGAETQLNTAATCSNCWGPPDETLHVPAMYGSSTTLTRALAANGAPKPSWHADIQEAVGAGKTVTITSGTLDGPVTARQGGTVKVENAVVDMNGFGIGAKGGGMEGDEGEGILTVVGSTFTNGGYLAGNSTALSVKNSIISGSQTGGYPINAFWNGGLFECNLVQTRTMTGQALELLGTSDLRVKNNRFVESQDFDVGFGFFGDRFHTNTRKLIYDHNTVVDGISLAGGVFLFQNQTYEIKDNNFLSNAGDLAGQRGARNYSDPFPHTRPQATDLRGNFYGVEGGPFIQVKFGTTSVETLYDGGGLEFRHSANLAPAADRNYPNPLWEPYGTEKHELSPCPQFAISNTLPIENEDTVTFTDNSFVPSGGEIVKRTWDFGDGSSAITVTTAGAAVEHTYASFGTKTVTLTTEADNGLSSTTTRTLRVLARPSPSFGVSPASPLETNTIVLSDTSTDPDGSISSRKWTLHDGTTSTASSVSKVYADGGTYSVTLEVTDNDGLAKSTTGSVTVGHVAPTANFNTAVAADGLTVSFTDASTHPKAGDAPPAGWTYAWDFAGLGSSSDRNAQFTFPSDSIFDITLTVTDNDGQSDVVTKSVDLRNILPTADFSVAPAIPVAGATANFDDLSTDSDGTIVAWLWKFSDDGSTSTQQNPSHVFAEGGDYVVELTATDNKGGTDTVSKEIHVCETQVISDGGVHVEVCGAITLSGLIRLAQNTVAEVPGLVDGAVATAEQTIADLQGQLPPL